MYPKRNKFCCEKGSNILKGSKLFIDNGKRVKDGKTFLPQYPGSGSNPTLDGYERMNYGFEEQVNKENGFNDCNNFQDRVYYSGTYQRVNCGKGNDNLNWD